MDTGTNTENGAGNRAVFRCRRSLQKGMVTMMMRADRVTAMSALRLHPAYRSLMAASRRRGHREPTMACTARRTDSKATYDNGAKSRAVVVS